MWTGGWNDGGTVVGTCNDGQIGGWSGGWELRRTEARNDGRKVSSTLDLTMDGGWISAKIGTSSKTVLRAVPDH